MIPWHQNFSGICPYKTEIKESANAMKQALSMCFLIMTWYGPLKTESQKPTFQSKFFFENSVILSWTKYYRQSVLDDKAIHCVFQVVMQVRV